MKKLEFKVDIKASANKVWWVLWNDRTYRQWTSVFHEGSYAVSDWKEGSKIHFLSPDGSGMYSLIHECKPNQKMSFKHLGVLKEFKEQPLDEETKSWSGAMENYILQEKDGFTKLMVYLDVEQDHKLLVHFKKIFPKALDKVKQLSENVKLVVEATVQASVQKVWEYWNDSNHIKNWYHASDDWYVPDAENNLKVGKKFKTVMSSKDNKMSFDFIGEYTDIKKLEKINYILADGRKVNIEFIKQDGSVKIIESFEPENLHPLHIQESGWQAILNNFKNYTENN